MMTEKLACCGLSCSDCRAYIATRSHDRKLAAEVAKAWSNPEEGNYTAEEIWCDGCDSDRLHGFCVRCPPRLCAKERKLSNCGLCKEYPCTKLKGLWASWVEANPKEAKANLDRVRARTPPS
jgi:hypothetical protein